jgi:hypothetical protein
MNPTATRSRFLTSGIYPTGGAKFVGVLITDGEGRYLVADGATGVRLVCGPVGQHQACRDAAWAVAGDQAGLEVLAAELLVATWLPDLCDQEDALAGNGQEWQIWSVLACGRPPPHHDRDFRWMTGKDLQRLVDRAVMSDSGDSGGKLAAERGITPEWIGLLERLLVITMPVATETVCGLADSAPARPVLPSFGAPSKRS